MKEVVGEGGGAALEGDGDGVGEVDLVDVACGDVVECGADLCGVLRFGDEVEFGRID